MTIVHSVRFYDLDPLAIHCMTYCPETQRIALSRSDASIEIWNVSCTPYLERSINGTIGSIEDLCWYKGRLFSGGLQGSVVEYNLLTQSPESMYPVTSGPCWCLAVHPDKKLLAAGTEWGYINIFELTEDSLCFSKILDKQEGKILCAAWEKKGDFLVTGSVDTVRIWNVEKGHVIHRMTTGRDFANKATVVWCLAVTDNFTIISGDSRGKLCFWDGNTGCSITSYQSHKADIICLALAETQDTVYCSGVDPLIATYEYVKIRDSDERGKWVKSVQRSIHDHDVRALVVSNKRLFSAGIDGYLSLSSHPPKLLLRYPPLLPAPSVVVCKESSIVLLKYRQHLVVWKLGAAKGKKALKLLEWRPPTEIPIKAVDLSSNATWMAVSFQDKFRLYSTVLSETHSSLSKVKIKSKDSLNSLIIKFSPDSTHLVLATVSGEVQVIFLSKDDPKTVHTFSPITDGCLTDCVSLLSVSHSAEYIVAADCKSNIVVWSKGKVHTKLPVYKRPPTAMALQPESNLLIVVYDDHRIVEYSVTDRKFTNFSRELEDRHPSQWLSRTFPVTNISFDSHNPDLIFLHDDTTIMVINKKKELPDKEDKIPRLESSHSLDSSEGNQHPFDAAPKYAFHVLKIYKHLVYFGFLSSGEAVAIEVSPSLLNSKLPPSMKKKKYGTG